MTPRLWSLFRVEFRRQWTLSGVGVAALLLIISVLLLVTASHFDKQVVASRKVAEVFGMLVPLVCALSCVGIVSNDVKDGWLRTLLVRPITRQQYLAVRMAVAFCFSWIVVLVAGGIPVAVRLIATGLPVVFDPLLVTAVLVLLVGASMTYIAILTFLSCWVPGFFNVAVLAAWGMVNLGANFTITQKFWDDQWAVVLADFLFPSGFFEAVRAVSNALYTPTADILWGIAALMFFTALAFWSITKITIERGEQ